MPIDTSIKGPYVLFIIPEPKGCGECPLNDKWNDACNMAKKSYHNGGTTRNGKPDFCPLQPMYGGDDTNIESGLMMIHILDPTDCKNCLMNDAWGHCCRATGDSYTYEQLHSGKKLPTCPLKDLYRDPYGCFRVIERDINSMK